MDTIIHITINQYLQLRQQVDQDPLLLLLGRHTLEQGTITAFIISLQEQCITDLQERLLEIILQGGLLIIHQVFQTTPGERLDLTRLFQEAKVMHTYSPHIVVIASHKQKQASTQFLRPNLQSLGGY